MNVQIASNLRKQLSLWALIFTATCSVPFSAQAGRETGADFLKIPIGAEPAGMGQAYTASAHGINSLNWNPAGIANRPTMMDAPLLGVSLSHQDQLSENNLDHLGVVVPMHSRRTTWGLDLIRLSYADQERRDENRNVVGSVGASDMALGAALAHDFGGIQAGTQIKLIHMELAGVRADGVAMDLGVVSRTPNPRLTIGMAARNIGPRMQFMQDSFDLPLTLSIGTAFRVTSPLTLACDLHVKPHQRQAVVSVGGELATSKFFSLRAGYLAKLAEAIPNNQTTETNRGDIGGVSGLAGGFGLIIQQFSLDYSITPFGELGNTQMLTLSTWFGGEEKKSTNVFDTPQDNRTILSVPLNDGDWWK